MSEGTPAALRVVIADDEPDVVFLLRMQLEREGFDVIATATEGSAARRAAEAGEADAVVMDLLMPGVNGFEAIAALQQALPGTAIVAYTAVAGEFVRDEMARVGVPLVLKSGRVDRLAEVIRETVAALRAAGGRGPEAGG